MKFASVVAAAAVTALCQGRVMSEWSKTRVRQTRLRYERIYGPGLTGLRNEKTGKIEHHRFEWSRPLAKEGKQKWMKIDGVEFDANTWNAMFYGLTSGMQYDGVTKVDQPMSNCFFASANVVEDFDAMVYSWNHMSDEPGAFDWFNPFVYGPLHVLGDTTVVLEHCDLDQYVEVVADIASLDWGLIAERATAISVDALLNYPDYQDDVLNALGWYVPPRMVDCEDKEKFKTENGMLDDKAYKDCLTLANEQAKEIQAYEEVKDYCYGKYLVEEA